MTKERGNERTTITVMILVRYLVSGRANKKRCRTFENLARTWNDEKVKEEKKRGGRFFQGLLP